MLTSFLLCKTFALPLAAAQFLFLKGNSDSGMVYDLSLQPVGLTTGLLLIGIHAFTLVRASDVKRWVRAFPRSDMAGRILLTIVAIWAFCLVATMDLGEFSNMRGLLMLIVPALYLMTLYYVSEFLAVRALAMFLLLAAELLLDAAFLRPSPTRLLLPILAYAWIFLALFWIGMPYLLRDQIAWLTAKPSRFRAACMSGVAYGLAMFVCAIFFYGVS